MLVPKRWRNAAFGADMIKGSACPKWKVLLVQRSGLVYSEVCLRLEPMGLDLVAQACRQAVYATRLLDPQVRVIGRRVPDPIVAISCAAEIPKTGQQR